MPVGAEKYGKCHSGKADTGSVSEPGICQTRSRTENHYTAR